MYQGGGRLMTSAAAADQEMANELNLVTQVPLGDASVAALLTLKRTDSRNPIDKVTIGLLKTILSDLIDEGDVAAVILTGAGDAFSAGGDLKGYRALYRNPASFKTFMKDFDEVCRILETAPFLTIAMINRTSAAARLGLSRASDF